MASQRCVPKPDHKTFNTMSEEEMVEAFHKMPELEGCWIENGRYVCSTCGKSYPNPYILFCHRITHPADMKPFSADWKTGYQQTQGVATQTTVEHLFTDGKRNHKRNLIKDQGEKMKKFRNIRCESANIYVNDDDDDDDDDDDEDDSVQYVKKVVKPMKWPMKIMKAKTQDTVLYKTLISVDSKSTTVKSKPLSEQIVKETGRKSKPSIGGDRKDLGVSSDSEREEDYSKLCDSDEDRDSIGNQRGRPNQKLEKNQFKKKETHVYRSLISVKGQSFEKPVKPPPYEYCVNMFGHNFLDKCKLMKGRYYCDECPSLYSSPYLLLNHKLYHAKRKCLNKRHAAQEGTTGKDEDTQIDPTNKEEKAQVFTTDTEEEAQVEDGMCFECNMCQVKVYSSDGLADHIEAHADSVHGSSSCSFSDSACAVVTKCSTSTCSTVMTDDAVVVKIKKEPISGYGDDGNTKEAQPETAGLDSSVKMKQETELSSLPQHSTEGRIKTDEMDVHLEDKLFLKRLIFSPVVRLERIEIEPNEVYIVK